MSDDIYINIDDESPKPIDIVQVEFDKQDVYIDVQQDYAPVLAVNGKIGYVTITAEDIGLSGSNNLTNIVYTTGNQTISGIKTFSTRPTVNGTDVLLSGEVAGLPTTIVYTTGNQTISGDKNFVGENLSFGKSTRITTDGDFLYIRRNDGEMILSAEEYILLDNVYPSPKTSLYWGGRTLNNTSGYPVLDWSNPGYISITNNLLINGTGVRLNAAKNITYSQLTGLKYSSGLIPGDYYKINDYITKWRNNSINDTGVLSGKYVEPLVVQAVSISEIDHRAYSTIYPRDEIYYNLIDNPSFIPNFKGYIYRRKDPNLNIDIGLDWRNLTANCCTLDLQSAVSAWSGNYNYQQHDTVYYGDYLFFSLVDNNSGINPISTFGAQFYWRGILNDHTYIPTDESNWKILADRNNDFNWKYSIPFNTGSRRQFPIFSSNMTGNAYLKLSGVSNIFIKNCSNTVFNNSIYDFINNLKIDTSYNNLFGPLCMNNEISYIEKSIIGFGFSYNNISQCINNVIGGNSSNNFCYNDLIDNFIGDSFSNNIIHSALTANVIGRYCVNNVIKAGSTILYNIIGDEFTLNSFNSNAFQYNTIDNNFKYNTINGIFYFNEIADGFQNNVILSDVSDNIIENGCVGNEFKKIFNNNTGIKNNFVNNIIDTDVESLNFSSSTHVYNEYNTRIFKNSNLNYRLGYYGDNDQLIITDVTS